MALPFLISCVFFRRPPSIFSALSLALSLQNSRGGRSAKLFIARDCSLFSLPFFLFLSLSPNPISLTFHRLYRGARSFLSLPRSLFRPISPHLRAFSLPRPQLSQSTRSPSLHSPRIYRAQLSVLFSGRFKPAIRDQLKERVRGYIYVCVSSAKSVHACTRAHTSRGVSGRAIKFIFIPAA